MSYKKRELIFISCALIDHQQMNQRSNIYCKSYTFQDEIILIARKVVWIIRFLFKMKQLLPVIMKKN
jgi:hypothetical protein